MASIEPTLGIASLAFFPQFCHLFVPNHLRWQRPRPRASRTPSLLACRYDLSICTFCDLP